MRKARAVKVFILSCNFIQLSLGIIINHLTGTPWFQFYSREGICSIGTIFLLSELLAQNPNPRDYNINSLWFNEEY